MRILIISSKGRGLGVAYKLQQEGHEVVLKISDPYADVGNGIVPRTHGSIRKVLDQKIDYVLVFGYQFGDLSSYLMDKGYPVIGDCPFSEIMETNDEYRQMTEELLQQKGENPLDGFVQCGWFNGEDFLPNFYQGRVHQRTMPGEIGPAVPSSGASLLQVRGRPSGLTRAIERPLRSSKYVGPVIVHGGKLSCYFYPGITECMLVMLRQPLGEFFRLLGEKKARISKNRDWAVAIQVSVPPYPNQKIARQAKGIGLLGSSWETNEGLKYLWMEDVMREGDTFFCAGTSGSLGYATAHGRTLKETRRRAIRLIERMDVANVQFRSDIGEG